MSAVADFRLIETSKLNDLRDNAEIVIEKGLFTKKAIDNYWAYVNANSKKLEDFEWSGYIFANLLVYLEEKKGINLLKSKYDDITKAIIEKRQNSTFILTFDHKQKYLNELSPGKFTLEELIEFNKDFSGEDDPELAKAEIEGIKALRNHLELLKDERNVILLSVG